jgi:hypothetical protein
MTKGRVLFWLVAALAAAGGTVGLLVGKPDEVAKWFSAVKWIAGDSAAAQGPAGGRARSFGAG